MKKVIIIGIITLIIGTLVFSATKFYNKEVIKEAVVYSDIAKQPNRKKCALLTWQGMKKVIMEAESHEKK